MKKAISKSDGKLELCFEGKACSRLSVRGAPDARYSGSAPRFAQRSGYNLILFSAILWSFVAASTFAQTDFDNANQGYAQGHFKEAISGYEALVRAGQWSANLFYDLGNAYFRVGDFGHAILNYERALALDRHHPEADANLRIVRDEARALELTATLVERYLKFANVNQFTIAAAIALWVATFCIVVLIFARRRSGAVIALSIVSLSIFAVTVFAAYELDD